MNEPLRRADALMNHTNRNSLLRFRQVPLWRKLSSNNPEKEKVVLYRCENVGQVRRRRRTAFRTELWRCGLRATSVCVRSQSASTKEHAPDNAVASCNATALQEAAAVLDTEEAFSKKKKLIIAGMYRTFLTVSSTYPNF